MLDVKQIIHNEGPNETCRHKAVEIIDLDMSLESEKHPTYAKAILSDGRRVSVYRGRSAWIWHHYPDKQITLAQAAEEFPVAQSTMSQAAREGRLEAQKFGGTWLTTRAAIENAIEAGTLRPRK